MLVGTFWLGVLASWISKALAFIVMIAIIAFVHEMGHHLIAKMSGVKVYEFSLGFGHKIWGRQWGETEYTLRWIPLGAFVRPAGMNPDEDEAEGESDLKGRSFGEKNFFIKQAILAGGAAGNILFAALVFTAYFHIQGLQSSNILVSVASPGKPAATAGVLKGDIITALDGKALTSHRDGIKYINAHAGEPVKVEVLRYSPAPDVTLQGPDIGLEGTLSISPLGAQFEIAKIEPGMGADKAGLVIGDLIASVGDKRIDTFRSLEDLMKSLRQGPAPLKIKKPSRLVLTVVPEAQASGVGLIGIGVHEHLFGPRKPIQFSEAVKKGFRHTIDGVFMIYQQAVGLLVTSIGKMTVPKEVGGPLMIASEIARGVDIGWIYLLRLTGLLSLAIGVFNLLPIPALDGGRMFVLLIKTILELGHLVLRPRAESHEVIGARGEEVLHFMGFVFLIFLIIVVSWKDVRQMMGDDGNPMPAASTSTPATTPTSSP